MINTVCDFNLHDQIEQYDIRGASEDFIHGSAQEGGITFASSLRTFILGIQVSWIWKSIGEQDYRNLGITDSLIYSAARF